MSRITDLNDSGLRGNPCLSGITPHELKVHHSIGGCQFYEFAQPRRPSLDKRECVFGIRRLGPVLGGVSIILKHDTTQFYCTQNADCQTGQDSRDV